LIRSLVPLAVVAIVVAGLGAMAAAQIDDSPSPSVPLDPPSGAVAAVAPADQVVGASDQATDEAGDGDGTMTILLIVSGAVVVLGLALATFRRSYTG
jgi:hypothetical protein